MSSDAALKALIERKIERRKLLNTDAMRQSRVSRSPAPHSIALTFAEADAVLAALRSPSVQEPGSAWQAISTAPKEAWVLAWAPDYGVLKAICDPDGLWLNTSGADISGFLTHWQPMPAPPVPVVQEPQR